LLGEIELLLREGVKGDPLALALRLLWASSLELDATLHSQIHTNTDRKKKNTTTSIWQVQQATCE